MKVAFRTLGCKLNQAETRHLIASLRQLGHRPVNAAESADVLVVNTCSVTSSADKECRQVIRRVIRQNPGAFVVVTGCYAQLKPDVLASIEGVDLVLGHLEKGDLLSLAGDFEKQAETKVLVSDVANTQQFCEAVPHPDDGRTRAFLKVQDGCDYGCSYCTVPLARGPSRSQSVDATVTQARRLFDVGYREIVLTGVNIGDYRSVEMTQQRGLVDLLLRLHDIEGLRRLRLSSIEPNLLTDEIIELAATSDRLLPHFHIPLQSGSDWILGLMRRRYRSQVFAKQVSKIVENIDDCAIGCDVVVGFPGESDADFQQTLRLIASLPIAYVHAFTFSPRPDTPAAALPDPVDRAEQRRRTRALVSLGAQKRASFVGTQLEKIRPVLFESITDSGHLTGLTDNYIRVRVEGSSDLIDQIAMVELGKWREGYGDGVLV